MLGGGLDRPCVETSRHQRFVREIDDGTNSERDDALCAPKFWTDHGSALRVRVGGQHSSNAGDVHISHTCKNREGFQL